MIQTPNSNGKSSMCEKNFCRRESSRVSEMENKVKELEAKVLKLETELYFCHRNNRIVDEVQNMVVDSLSYWLPFVVVNNVSVNMSEDVSGDFRNTLDVSFIFRSFQSPLNVYQFIVYCHNANIIKNYN